MHLRRGEIWVVSLNPTEGGEQQGHRPIFIVSAHDFNKVTRCPVVLPITNGGNFARMRGFAVSLSGTGLTTTGVVRCDQPRVLDIAARKGRYIETAPSAIIDDVLARVVTLFE